MPRAVKFDRYGGIDVLRVVEVDRPVPGPEQVIIRMKAAGINPGEAAIREGAFAKQWPATFPSGQGSDLAGVVEAVGRAVRNVAVGDEVIGFTNNRSSHAELVVVEADHLIGRPTHVSWEQAGALFVAGTTAYAAVHAVSLKAGDTVVISGAAGGVGSIAVQLAKILGAKVIGLASAENHTWLAEHGVIAVVYGEGVADRIRIRRQSRCLYRRVRRRLCGSGARTRCRARSDRYDHQLRGSRETPRQDGGQQRRSKCQGPCRTC